LAPLLEGLPQSSDPNLLLGSASAEDAGVYRIGDELALVQSVDFFTPIVDDPYDFGRIAAVNSLSDIYAMGARPLTGLNLVAWPMETLGPDPLAEVLRGGAEVAEEAGLTIVGGHSIDDREPKFGLSVTALAHPAELMTNAGAKAGDALVLTKPVGSAAITTALKKGLVDGDTVLATVEVMTQLNAAAAEAAKAADANAVTDVTGYGLLGHLHELSIASGVAAEVDATAVPAIANALSLLADDRTLAGGSRENRRVAETYTSFDPNVDEPRRRLLCDAMTSGGLLIAVAPDRAAELPGQVIGRIGAGSAGMISVK
jgi:selenide, water dikinase